MKNLDYLEENLVMLEYLVPANYIHCKIGYLHSLHRYDYIKNNMFIFIKKMFNVKSILCRM